TTTTWVTIQGGNVFCINTVWNCSIDAVGDRGESILGYVKAVNNRTNTIERFVHSARYHHCAALMVVYRDRRLDCPIRVLCSRCLHFRHVAIRGFGSSSFGRNRESFTRNCSQCLCALGGSSQRSARNHIRDICAIEVDF